MYVRVCVCVCVHVCVRVFVCVTTSMPKPLREGGPPCALGLRSRAPTEENPKRGHGSDGISKVRVHGMLHVLSKVWEALRRLLKEVQKGAPTEGATALKPHPDALVTLLVKSPPPS